MGEAVETYEQRHAREMAESKEVQKRGHSLTLHFESEDDLQGFRGWFLDGGGEYQFNQGREDQGEAWLSCVWDHNGEQANDWFTFLRSKDEEEE